MNLVFLVPIRHPLDCKNPGEQFGYLRDLFTCMQAQTSPDWQAILITNPEQALPPLPDRVCVVHVDLPPNLARTETPDRTRFYQTIARDKGMRLRAGLKAVSPDDMLMVCDDDDLIHADLVRHVIEHTDPKARHGWYVDKGYVWRTDEDHFRILDRFHRVCGTSLIGPPQYFDAWHDEDTTGTRPSTMELGNHKGVFEKIGTGPEGFRPIPFRASIYRRGHLNATQAELPAQQTTGWRRRLINRSMFTRAGWAKRIEKLRQPHGVDDGPKVPLTAELKQAFFGEAPS